MFHLQQTLGWLLFAVICVVVAILLLKPIVAKPVLQEVAASELYHIGEDAHGESWYIVMKHEFKDWMDMLVRPLAPFGLAAWGVFLKRRYNGNKSSNNR